MGQLLRARGATPQAPYNIRGSWRRSWRAKGPLSQRTGRDDRGGGSQGLVICRGMTAPRPESHEQSLGRGKSPSKSAAVRARHVATGAALLALMAAGLGACGSSSTSTSKTGSTGSQSPALRKAAATVAAISKPIATIPQTVPLPRTPPKGDTIVYMYGGGVSSQATLANEVHAAANAIGWNYYGINFDQSNPATLMAGLQTALSKHPTVVASAAQPYSEFTSSVISEYKTAKVPLIFAGQATALPRSKLLIGNPLGPAAYGPVGTDLAAWFINDSAGQGKLLYITLPQLPLFDSLNAAFKREVSELCPRCKSTNVPMTIDQASDPSEETSIVVSALQRNPGYKYVFFPDGAFATGITSALSSAGLSGVKVFGQDYQPAQGTALQAGSEAAWLGQSLKLTALEIMDLALRNVEKAPGSANDNLLPERLMTHSNIGSELTFDEPSDALQLFEKLWKVPVTR